MSKKKRYMIVPRTDRIKNSGLQTGKGNLSFKGKTAMWVDDPAVAREIDAQHGLKGSGNVWVAQDENLEWHEKNDGLTDGKKLGIHRYTFAQIGTSLPDRKSLIGKKKMIGGTAYMYVLQDGKMKLSPYKKRTRAGQQGAEQNYVHHAV